MNENINPSVKGGTNRPYRRRVRNILIHKPMQREFTLVLLALLMISAFAVGFVIQQTIRDVALGGGYHFGQVSPYELLSDLSYKLIMRVSCILFVSLIIIGLFAVFFLHRIAGPIYRFTQVFLRLNEGESPPPLQLREGDFFKEFAAEINLLIKKTQFEKEKKNQIKEKVNRILAANPDPAIAKSAKELKTLLDSEVS